MWQVARPKDGCAIYNKWLNEPKLTPKPCQDPKHSSSWPHAHYHNVPGTQHGPDGLSRCPWQPANDDPDPVDDLDFDDWVDQVYGFMHFLNPLRQSVLQPDLCATFASDAVDDDGALRDPAADTLLSYDSFPQFDKSREADECLARIRDWFTTLRQPANLTEKAYATFICYASHFFLKDSRLWRRDPQGYHKVVIEPNKWPAILAATHDAAGHHGNFATRAHIINCFWWPHLSTDIAWFV